MHKNIKGQFIKGYIPWNKGRECKEYNWGRPKRREQSFCIGCNKECYYGSKRCLSCYLKSIKKKEIFCICCGKKVINYRTKRCKSCNNIYRWKNESYKKKVSDKISDSKGGRNTKRYPRLFNKQLKEKTRVRDNFKCQLCGVPELELNKRLHIHHIDYNKKNIDINNLISLCNSCHTKTLTNRKYWMEVFNNENKRKIV